MTLWRADDAARATRGAASGWAASGVSIDTREIAPGDLFVALADRRDGHDFVSVALAEGAAAAMVSRTPPGVVEGAPLLMVGDVLEGLAALGRAGRARSGARVVGVTGSAGKTSAKEMLRAALGPRAHAAERSFNNHWGVPLTLARLPPEAEFAVVEIGMSAPGEIAPLSRLARPHVALVTTVGPAHLAAFGSLEGIAREKASIVRGLEPGGILVIPSGLPTTPLLRREAREARVVTFGEARGADLRLLDAGGDGAPARIAVDGATLDLALAAPGRHHLSNALGVLAVVRALGRDLEAAARALGGWSPTAGRGAREALRLPCGEVTLIDDAFNANPASVAAALAVLAAAPGRRVAVLGDMLELGEAEAALHAALADDPGLRAAHVVHTLGPRMRALHEALPGGRRGIWAPDAEAMARALPEALRDGDTVLVKGSKAIGAARVVAALRALGHPAPDPGAGAPLAAGRTGAAGSVPPGEGCLPAAGAPAAAARAAAPAAAGDPVAAGSAADREGSAPCSTG